MFTNRPNNDGGFSPLRAAVLFGGIAVGLVGLIGRVAYLQTYGRQQQVLRAERQHHQGDVLPARRGSIFDTNGALIACSVQNRGVYVDPHFMYEQYQEKDCVNAMDKDIAALADLLDRDAHELSALIADQSEQRYVKLSDGVDERTAQAIIDLKMAGGELKVSGYPVKMPGIGLMPVNKRVYPMGSLAAHIIGGVRKDQVGLDGLEMKYEKLLNGKDGYQRILKDARRRGIGVAEDDYIAPEHGQHLVLTIDANMQSIAEQELAAACEKFRATKGEVILLDPRTGEVLALANYPTFSPQNPNDSKADTRRNTALVSPYEPGSAIKPFIVGPAIQHGVTSSGRIWPINAISWYTPYGRRITDVHGYGPLTTWDVLVKSSNIGMCMISEAMGNDRLQPALIGFGFGQRTGIELPGEDPGLINPLSRWSKHSTDSVAQGYEMMVTPLQLARGFCAFANGGYVPPVRIVKGTVDADGIVRTRNPIPDLRTQPRPVSADAAMQIRRILADVPLRGTATSMKTKDPTTKAYEVPTWYTWNIFGKTGTAHISEGKAGYAGNRYNSTFLGGAPYENPRLVIAMTLHDPDRKIAHYGGTVSAPASARILGRCLSYLQVEPSPELELPPANVMAHLVHFESKVYQKPTATPAVAEARPRH